MHYYSINRQANTLVLVCNKLEKFKMLFLCGCVVAGIAYFWQVNSLATRGYRISELTSSIKALQQTTRELEVQAAAAQSLEKVTEKIQQLNMTTPVKVEYLRPVGSGVALR